MIKLSALLFGIFITIGGIAQAHETPDTTLAGAIVNGWNQAGLRVTDKLFDLAVQGRGFFVLQAPTGETVFTRYGSFSLNSDGFLVSNENQYLVLGFTNGELGPLNFTKFVNNPADGSLIKSMQVKLDGAIVGFSESGYSHTFCRISLALFNNAPRLRRISQHTLASTQLSGSPAFEEAGVEGRGSVYSSTLEELDEEMYRTNLK